MSGAAKAHTLTPAKGPHVGRGDTGVVQRCAILIPAYNEEASVAPVIACANAAGLGPVVVVDDGSHDRTGAVAEHAGAQVLALVRNRGKGGAVWEGIRAVETEVVVLLDADLINLTPAHIHALADPVLTGEADMTRGVFVGGRFSTTLAQKIAPHLSGQRAMLRERLLEVSDLAESRYGIEVAITRHAETADWRCRDVPLRGVSHLMKEEKLGLLRGFAFRLRGYAEILLTLFGPRPRRR